MHQPSVKIYILHKLHPKISFLLITHDRTGGVNYQRLTRTSSIDKAPKEQVLENVMETKLLNILQRRRLTWLGHTSRHEKIPGRVLEARVLGKRGRGKQRITLIKKPCIHLSMQSYLKLKRAMEDRNMWRKIIETFHDQPEGLNTWWRCLDIIIS